MTGAVDGNLLWPLTVGMASVLNPCGVAMLPATLAWLAGTAAPTSTWPTKARRGALAGVAMAAGFTLVVLIVALVAHAVGAVFARSLRMLMIVLGSALAVGGALVAFGLFHFPVERLVGTEWVSLARRRSNAVGTMVLAGVVYGIAAMSCTLPLFIAVVFPTFTGGFGKTFSTVGMFGLGAALLLVAASEGTLFARDILVRLLRRATRCMSPVLGGIIVGSGIYLVYYWALGPGRLI